MTDFPWKSCACVLIGRNESKRLQLALGAIRESAASVYVDSASTDESRSIALQHGIDVVDVDPNRGRLSAARARNEGVAHFKTNGVNLPYLLFVDGDCIVNEEFVRAGVALLDEHPEVGAVTGWTKEQFPEESVYNRLCDVEWGLGSVGEIHAFGGNVLVRRDAFEQIGGYSPEVVAAEDDDFAIRLRAKGWLLWRIDMPCVLHDADLHHFREYWKRAERCGWAYAQVGERWGSTPEKKFVGETRSAVLWGGVVPAAALVAAPFTYGASLLALSKYPAAAARQTWSWRQRLGLKTAFAWGVSCEVSKFAQFVGIVRYRLASMRGKVS